MKPIFHKQHKKSPVIGTVKKQSLARKELLVPIAWIISGALFPTVVMAVYYFGQAAAVIIAISIGTALLSEIAIQWLLKKPLTISDGNAFLIGLLFPLLIPASVPAGIPALGSFSAILISRLLFNRLDFMLFNPVLIGSTLVLFAFPSLLTTFVEPGIRALDSSDVVTSTPLMILKEHGMSGLLEIYHTKASLYIELFLGNRAGGLGETSVAALLLGAGFLMYKKYITWHLPVAYIASVGLFAWIFGGNEGFFTGDPFFHMLSGSLILCALFITTPVLTGPYVPVARIAFGIGCGALTVIIRLKGTYSEGAPFAILIMNCFSPLLDRLAQSSLFEKFRFGLIGQK
ncbi:MAG: RnfABCDGE type electron transport complex subunit D [Nitrospirota bacterium]